MQTINKAMRTAIHDKLDERNMKLKDFQEELGFTEEEAKQVLYGYKGNENVSFVPDEHYDRTSKWLVANYVG